MNEALHKFIDMHPEINSASPEELTIFLIKEINELREGGKERDMEKLK